MTNPENVNYAQKKHYFWFGGGGDGQYTGGVHRGPCRDLVCRTDRDLLAFIGVTVLFLSLFVFLSKLTQRGRKSDTDAVLEPFRKNEQVKKVLWTLFIAMGGLVLARVVDPVTAQQVVGIITGLGV